MATIKDDPIDWTTPAARRLMERDLIQHDADPSTPDPVDHDVAPLQPSGPMVELAEALVEQAEKLIPVWREHGPAILSRISGWVKVPKVPSSVNPENDDDTAPSEHLADEMILNLADDHRASRYYDEARDLAKRILADMTRLNTIGALARPPAPRQIVGREMLDAQIAAEGWCVSCWRWNQTVKEREKNNRGHYHDKEACDLCADFKREHGIYPPLSLLEVKHGQLKNWTSKLIEAALAEARRPKAKAS